MRSTLQAGHNWNRDRNITGKQARLTENSERSIGGNCARCVFGSAAVHAHVLWLDVHDEEDVVVGHYVHPALTGGGEICAAIFLPGNLW